MTSVSGGNKNMENKNKRKPHKFLEDTPYNGTVTLPYNLVNDIILELSICHGAYCTDCEDVIKKMDGDLWFRMDESQIIDKIKKSII